VVGVAQRNASYTVLAPNSDCSLHRGERSEVSRPLMTVPTLQRAESRFDFRLGDRIHTAILNGSHKARKAVDAVRVYPVTGRLTEQSRANLGAIVSEFELAQRARQRRLHFTKWNAIHDFPDE
jgi:hypothetical protein